MNGTTLVLPDPGNISLDGKKLSVDSNDFEGAFYKQNVRAGNFLGNHSFRFTDIHNQRSCIRTMVRS